MSRVLAAFMLIRNFVKDTAVSGWKTTMIILRGSKSLRPGLVRMPFGNLDANAASLLGALISLTPGTTTVDIDMVRREFLLHLLDTEAAVNTLAIIERDLLAPIRTMFGETA